MQNTPRAELVAQLRQEAQQWEGQYLRLEGTFRGEINAWKDQFLRIDAEPFSTSYFHRYASLMICLLGQYRYPDLVQP
jgi:hypothetical protein